MSNAIESQLNETLRDALVAYYLDEVVPNASEFVNAKLHDKITTANDLYEYKLLDVQVSQAVPTSPVASAIASLQQYINAALMGMEPGYETKVMEDHLITQWREINSQYAIWAANQMLTYYPELYIDPSLRMTKSAYFRQLENDINQNKIHIDTTQEAVLGYLASFEEVANLTVINGYINTDDFKNGMYYFIGKSRAESVYYWRSVDMSQRTYKNLNGTDPNRPKFDYPQPGAWSDWHKTNLPISASAIERTIRPVLFNNRLFVFWVECIDNSPQAVSVKYDKPPDKDKPIATVNANPMLRLNMVYKKYDDSWSVPQTCIQAWSEAPEFKTQALDTLVDSITVQDSSASPESMFVAMYAGYTAGAATDGLLDKYAFLMTAFIDKNFNVTPLFPHLGYVPDNQIVPGLKKLHVLKVGRLFLFENKGRFQFRVPAWSIRIKSVETSAPHTGSDNWDFLKRQGRIANPVVNNDVRYDSGSGALKFDSKIVDIFSAPYDALVVEADFYEYGGAYGFSLKLIIAPGGDPHNHKPLLAGSMIFNVIGNHFADVDYYDFFSYHSIADFTVPGIIDKVGFNSCYLPGVAPGDTYSITGKLVSGYFYDWLVTSYSHQLNIRLVKKNGLITKYFDFSGSTIPSPYFFQHVILRPPQLENPEPENPGQSALYSTSYVLERHPPDTQSISVPINPETLVPDWGLTWPGHSKKIPFIHGVKFSKDNLAVGHAIKSTLVELELAPALTNILIAPRINTRASPTLGVAEFIDFAGSGISKSDDGSALRQPIRMNTLFARELINRANIALENLLSWDTQLIQEPPLQPAAAVNEMDFHGANGLYFWELFLHLPFMVSHRLNQEQNFDGAEQWLGFIFDPARKADAKGRPPYWNVRPLMNDPVEMDYATRKPADPDGIASSHPVRYRKAIYLHYIKNLLDRGDAAYRQLTPDSLAEAKLWYVRVLDLLGPRPDVKVVDHWQPITLQTLSNSTSRELRAFEQRLIGQDQRHADSATANDGQSLYTFAEPPLYLRTVGLDPTLADVDNAYLRLPFNHQLVHTWDIAEARLDNLRNNRTLDGKALSLPLFAAPLNPRDLLAAFGQGAASGGAARLLAQEVPHYRFSVMHNRASSAVETLIQFGNTLLSLIERKEQGQFQELQAQQAWDFAQFAVDLQSQAQEIDVAQRNALKASRNVVNSRWRFYNQLSEEVVNAGEVGAGVLHLAGRVAEGVGAVANVIAGGLIILPNAVGGVGGAIVGMAGGLTVGVHAGGWRLEGIPKMVSAGAYGVAALMHGSAEALDRVEQFRRRHQEWKNARDQALLEIYQIDAQLKVLEEQVKATTLQLNQAHAAQSQTLASYDFLRTRFTNAQLYQWLNGQFATFYYQAYDATLALCLAAEACWQFERADFSSRFIQAGAWKDSYRGLTAGESLKLQLLKMNSAYLSRNERLLEITKTVSLRQLKDKDPESKINQDWTTIKDGLLANGRVAFELTRPMFDSNFPAHSLRRIMRISVSLPVVLGPYEDIHATLTQTYSAVQMGDSLKENMRASQQVALSGGVDDDGLFTFDFNDERYLPFEGTGAISRWELHFTSDDSEARNRQIESLTDIIVHLRYTAKAGQGRAT